MIILPIVINGVVIAVIATELIAIALGLVSADQLLVTSTISALLTLLSFKLSKDALSVIHGEENTPDPQRSDDA